MHFKKALPVINCAHIYIQFLIRLNHNSICFANVLLSTTLVYGLLKLVRTDISTNVSFLTERMILSQGFLHFPVKKQENISSNLLTQNYVSISFQVMGKSLFISLHMVLLL